MKVIEHFLNLNKKAVATSMVLLLFLCVFATSCTKKGGGESSLHSYAELNSKEELFIFESAEKESSRILCVNLTTGADAVFTYSGRTEVLTDKGEATVVDSIKCGELIRLTYNKTDNILNYIHVAKDSWTYDTLGGYVNVNTELGAINVEDKTYKAASHYMVYSNGTRTSMDNVVEKDALTVRGIDKTVYSITVTAGHGTVTLKDLDAYIGGWIEIGKVITLIKKDMVLDVPEGEYKVHLSRKGYTGEALVSVARGETSVIEASSVTETKASTGMLTFKIKPEEANPLIYLNGAKVETTEPMELPYGRYYLAIKAEGYETYGGTVVLQSPTATLEIELTKASASGGSSAASSGSGSSGTTSSGSGSSTMNSSERQSVLRSIQDAMNSISNKLYGN
ncbi:MAG: PEGA domain-containing protein [Lachnospiraceae bacterium]|nr:PEGA domain-containing protein [Lachnospiraceae bacterium]